MSKLGRQLKNELILRAPRITEKATYLTVPAKGSKAGPAYTFEVAKMATKPMVAQAFEVKYKLKPQKVTMVNLPAKATFRRGVKGSTAAVKKAMVFLKAGEKIEIV
ncbi:MAG: 50S ribosomal protein L23 [Candidatus Vogelbacteria bacterium CG10_big_fil_rev_8_21_14_0_10_49_38]|uniref:50S ribosomal protein L23 n=1 Tax=Candidatus Vogelbacteria bacterium CG10_big_fil_rev_8_21_14_0_10_49_38 TaxID=1975043 RepID=A0A2H0RIT2_9BACT|nr:MAG: 50S ribosomal protein L23 [Candidatus Vogelbacteria bacterium CG10_big_fil_rev_8_21_14_0_10_49_38]